MAKGVINRILSNSAVDGCGNRAVVFMQGCNFNCLYCHNPETINHCGGCGVCIDACQQNALTLGDNGVEYNPALCTFCDDCLKACSQNSSPRTQNLSPTQTMKIIAKNREFISGVTVSGGECSLQLDFVTELFTLAKADGLHTLADSNGSIDYSNKDEFLAVCDGVMLDVKAYDNEEHLKLTGRDNLTVLANLEFLARAGKLSEVRTVVVPEVLDNHNTVAQVSRIIAAINPQIRYKLIRYREHGVRRDLISSYTPNDEYMAELSNLACQNGCQEVLVV